MRVVAHLFLCGALLLAVGQASGAAPRGASIREEAKEDPAAVTADPAAWSKRLLGRFAFDGVIHHDEIIDFNPKDDAAPAEGEGEIRGPSLYLQEWAQPIEGKGDCIDFSDGPGLQCVVNVVWPQMWREQTGKAQLGGVSDMTPAMALAGFVTSTPGGIRILLVNDKGLAHPGALTLKGDTASAKVPCVNLPGMQVCNQLFKIEARPGAGKIFVTLSIRTRFIRSKLERKQALDLVGDRVEKSTEWVEELLEVSFAMGRESQDAKGAAPPAAQ